MRAVSTCSVLDFHLSQERKELIKGSYRDKHFNAGSILLGFGVFESVYGGVNTWFRTGKLFPGPHLFAGAGNGHEFLSFTFLQYTKLLLNSNLYHELRTRLAKLAYLAKHIKVLYM